MKASYITEHGGPDVFTYGDLPDPVAGENEVLVEIHAASVNAADWKVRSGHNGELQAFPYVLGRDFSGTVSGLGPGTHDFGIGDAVFGVCDRGQEGTYAERIAMRSDIIAPKPGGLSHVEAAAVALTGLTALVSVEDTLGLRSGETILIQGGAGGVAGFAIQLAKHIGARVITTASAKNHHYVRGLGADEIIDYRSADFTGIGRTCDAVLDTVGGEVATRSFAVMKPGGRAAFIGSGPNAPASPRDDVASLRPAVGRDREHLDRLADLVVSGAVKVPEITEYPLSAAAEAHRVSEGRHLRGKLVFRVRD